MVQTLKRNHEKFAMHSLCVIAIAAMPSIRNISENCLPEIAPNLGYVYVNVRVFVVPCAQHIYIHTTFSVRVWLWYDANNCSDLVL